MALVSEMVVVSIKELGLNRVEPKTETEWSIINNYLLERCN